MFLFSNDFLSSQRPIKSIDVRLSTTRGSPTCQSAVTCTATSLCRSQASLYGRVVSWWHSWNAAGCLRRCHKLLYREGVGPAWLASDFSIYSDFTFGCTGLILHGPFTPAPHWARGRRGSRRRAWSRAVTSCVYVEASQQWVC